MKRHYIHIGMPRTATTFLQRIVFPRLPNFEFYGPPYTQINGRFNRMLFEDETTFDIDGWKSEINSLEGDNILISNENFVGQSLFWHFGNRTTIARRLHAAMPEATIVLFLRNQADLIRSLYLLSLQESETASLRDYFIGDTKPYDLDLHLSQPSVDLYEYAPFDTYHAKERLKGFNYLSLIELYQSLFPRVEILLYEDFKERPAETFQKLSQIFEVTLPESLFEEWAKAPIINSSTGQKQANLLRRLNRWRNMLYASAAGRAFYVRARRFILNKVPQGHPLTWPEKEWSILKNYYGNQNTALHERFPEIGLARHAKKYFIE